LYLSTVNSFGGFFYQHVTSFAGKHKKDKKKGDGEGTQNIFNVNRGNDFFCFVKETI